MLYMSIKLNGAVNRCVTLCRYATMIPNWVVVPHVIKMSTYQY